MRYLSVVLMAGLLVAAQTKDDPKKELDKFAGTWLVVSAEQAGAKTPEETLKPLNLKLVITGDKYESKSGDTKIDAGTIAVDATKSPKTVDVMPSEGTRKGKKLLAIYEFNGDELKCCYDLEGKERPKEFTTKPGTQQLLIVYKKQK
jgi:uncharacterized protein (TIGR03067 family)